MAGEPTALRTRLLLVAATVLALVAQGLVAGSAYADHEGRFRGQGGAAVDIGLIAWTAVGAVLAFAALLAIVLWWERRDEAAVRRAEKETRQGEGRF